MRLVSRAYLETMGIRIVAGRGLREGDGAGQPRVLVVNEALARTRFAGTNPLGQRVYIGRDTVPFEIVGVARDVRQFALDEPAEPQMFADMRQWGSGMPVFPVGAYYVVRTEDDPAAVTARVRALARDLEPQAALFNVARMDDLLATTMARPRMYAVLLALFAVIGLSLAVIGVYGVMAYAVTQRTREIGIRVALGAPQAQVVALVLRRSLVLTTLGIGVGLAGAAGLSRSLAGLLFGLTPLDAGTFGAVTILFLAVALGAAFVPARRAARIDPQVALRAE
jgi:predicted permease